jgi:transcriptional regulator with XRE-family HTH domain
VALPDLESLQKQIGKRIKALRTEKKLSQQQLAVSCNLEKSHLSRIEAGGQNLTLRMLLRIAKALDVEVRELFA